MNDFFTLRPKRVDIRRDIVFKSWRLCRMQKRFAGHVATLGMELSVSPRVPKRGDVDAGRVVQLLTNVLGASGGATPAKLSLAGRWG